MVRGWGWGLELGWGNQLQCLGLQGREGGRRGLCATATMSRQEARLDSGMQFVNGAVVLRTDEADTGVMIEHRPSGIPILATRCAPDVCIIANNC